MEVFFYGLFMDQEILRENGVNPKNPRTAYLDNYELKIGERASLIQSEDQRSYGVLMELDPQDLDLLYSEASVADYKPEKVEVILGNGKAVSAYCYNLPKEVISGTNKEYAKKLLALARKLRFPEEYLSRIEILRFD